MSCSMGSLPGEFFDHPIYHRLRQEHPPMVNFLRCIARKHIRLDACRHSRWEVERHCGYRFGNMSEDRLLECNRALTGIDSTAVEQFKLGGFISPRIQILPRSVHQTSATVLDASERLRNRVTLREFAFSNLFERPWKTWNRC